MSIICHNLIYIWLFLSYFFVGGRTNTHFKIKAKIWQSPQHPESNSGSDTCFGCTCCSSMDLRIMKEDFTVDGWEEVFDYWPNRVHVFVLLRYSVLRFFNHSVSSLFNLTFHPSDLKLQINASCGLRIYNGQ